MPTERIKYEDVLRVGTDKLNQAIDQANKSEVESVDALEKSDKALSAAAAAKVTADSTRTELDAVVIRATDTDAMSRQAAVDATGVDQMNLKQRLDKEYNETAARVAEKVGGANKATMDDLGQDVKEALTGGAVAVVGVGAVGTPNVQTKAITTEKTDFLRRGKNHFNKKTVIPGYIVNNTTGNLTVNASYNASDFIPILPSTVYTRTTDLYMAFYNENKVYISGFSIGTGNLTFTTPTNAHYCRITNVTAFLDTCQLELGPVTTSYEPYHVKFENILLETENLPKVTLSTIVELQAKAGKNDERFVVSKNLFDKNTVTKGFIVSSSSGNLAANATYSVSDYIFVKSGYVYTRSSDLYLAFYTENKVFISGFTINAGKTTFATPVNAVYLRVTVLASAVNTFQLEEGSVATPYAEYGTKLIGVDVIPYSPLQEEEGVNFGDSITQGASFPAYVAAKTGATILNAGFGATRLARYDNPTYPYSLIGMTEIADAIASGDWSIMQPSIDAIDAATGKTIYATIYNKLKAIDWTKVSFITMMYGTNDMMNNSLRLGEPESTDPYEINGALNYIITKIQTKYPHIKIYLMSPIFRQVIAGHEGNSDTVAPSVFLYEIAAAFKERANKYHIPFKDMYNESGINALTASYYLKDGTHPGDAGNKRLDHLVYGFLSNN